MSRVIVICAVALQPFESITVTLYVPESVMNNVSVVTPVLHVVEANFPESVSVSMPPVSAITGDEGLIVTMGIGLTITFTVSE